MKEEKDHLKKLFSDFVPEESDARIDEGWEKMRYFLPQEKKRRAAAYFFGCFGLGLIVLGGLVASLLLFNDDALPVATVDKTEKQVEEKFSAADAKINSAPGPGANKIHLHKIAPAVKKAEPAKATQPDNMKSGPEKNNAVNNTTQPLINQTDHATITAHNEPAKPETIMSAAYAPKETSSANNTTIAPAITNDKDYIKHDEPLNGDSSGTLTVSYLPQIVPPDPVPDSLYLVPQLVPIKPPLVLPRAVFYVQIFGGPDHTQTVLNDLRYGEKKQSALNASGGLALGYQFRNKLSVMGQAVYSESRLNYEHVLIEKTTPVNNIQPIIANFDSTLVSTTSRLSSTSGYNLAFGLGYQLYCKARIELVGFALFSWRSVKYTFTEIDSVGVRATTNSFPQNISVVPANFPRPDTRSVQTIKTAGITAGVTLGYRFYKDLFVILRPSYCLQLPGDKGTFGDLFRIKRNTMYFDLGIQLKLKRSAR